MLLRQRSRHLSCVLSALSAAAPHPTNVSITFRHDSVAFPISTFTIQRAAHCSALHGTRVVRQAPVFPAAAKRPWMCTNMSCFRVNGSGESVCKACGGTRPMHLRWACNACGEPNDTEEEAKAATGGGGAVEEKCSKCDVPRNIFVSSVWWSCSACKKCNRVTSLQDSGSRCGHCGYDMEPKTKTERALLKRALVESKMREDDAARINMQSSLDNESWGVDMSGNGSGWHATGDGEVTWSTGVNADWDPISVNGVAGWNTAPSNSFSCSKNGFKPPVTSGSAFPKRRGPLRPRGEPRARPMRQSLASPAHITDPPEFPWVCPVASCGATNSGNDLNCRSCGVKLLPTAWQCQACGAENHWARGSCFNCTQPIIPAWKCKKCGESTSVYANTCRGCGASFVSVEPVDGRSLRVKGGRNQGAYDWICVECRATNYSWRENCIECKALKSGLVSVGTSPTRHPSETEPEGDAWGPPQENHTLPVQSGSWGSPAAVEWGGGGGAADVSAVPARPAGAARPSSTRIAPVATVTDNNWQCPQCDAANFRTRVDCWKCGSKPVSFLDQGSFVSSLTPELTKGSESESNIPVFEHEGFQNKGSTFAPSAPRNSWTTDWACGKCFTCNFHFRKTCKMCGSAKEEGTLVIEKKVTKL